MAVDPSKKFLSAIVPSDFPALSIPRFYIPTVQSLLSDPAGKLEGQSGHFFPLADLLISRLI